MSKLISQLPEDIKAVALQRQQNDIMPSISDNLDMSFFWDATPEKYEIWQEVNNGNYEPFRAFHAKQQPENNGWISVEDRLPSIDEDDVFNKEHKITKKCLVLENGKPYFGYCFLESKRWNIEGIIGNINITHWQPVPQPPTTKN